MAEIEWKISEWGSLFTAQMSGSNRYGSIEVSADKDGDLCIEHEVPSGWSGGTSIESVYLPIKKLIEFLQVTGHLPKGT